MESSSATVLTFGVDRYVVRTLSDAGIAVEPDLRAKDAVAAVEDRRVRAVVFAHGDPISDAAAVTLRAAPAMDEVASIALVAQATFDSVAVAFSSGADDVAGIDEADSLAKRLDALIKSRAQTSSPVGRALVADSVRGRRMAIGRVLRRAGFDVRFALDATELARESTRLPQGSPVVSEPRLAFDSLRSERASQTLWVLTSAPEEVSSLRRTLRTLAHVAVHDHTGANENVLFHLNELSNPAVGNARATPRVLWSAPVRYRKAGSDEGGWGMAFNLNKGGLYVRTLGAPARATDLWLEMRPEGANRRIHLDARVVWHKPFGAFGRPLAPAGMGLVFQDATAADRALLDSGYEALRASDQTALAA